MQLTCPGCGARYRIDATSWPAGPGPDGEAVHRPRRARCKVCRTIWDALPEEDVLELDNPMPPEEPPRLADAAWASVSGWPDPKPLPAPPAPRPVFSPPLDRPPPVFSAPAFSAPGHAEAPIHAAPARPSISFEAPPVPIPAPAEPRAVRPRLLGPGAWQDEPEEAPEDEPDEERPEEERTPEEWAEEAWSEEDRPRRRWWRWLLALLVLLALAWAALVATGRVRPEDYGLPPFNPAAIGLDRVQLSAIALPRTPPPPLTIEADALKRRLSDDRQIWEVKGVIRNPTAGRLPVPPVEILLLDAEGRTVGRWMVRPEIENLAPGGVARFETSAIDPPSSASRMRLQLKPAELGRL